MSISIEFLASYSGVSEFCDTARLCWPSCLPTLTSVHIIWSAHTNYSYFDISACNWASYHTFNVIVLKCTRYYTLNVSQTGCTVAYQLGFKTGSLLWRASSLPIKPSGPAKVILTFSKNFHVILPKCFKNFFEKLFPNTSKNSYLSLKTDLSQKNNL